MPKIITKVKSSVKGKDEGKHAAGWKAVLADLQADIKIVERKIKRGEPWPGDSATQN
jgi:hypothetical protein